MEQINFVFSIRVCPRNQDIFEKPECFSLNPLVVYKCKSKISFGLSLFATFVKLVISKVKVTGDPWQKEEQGILPGSLRVGLIRYGLSRDIKIDLSLIEDIQDFTNVVDDVLIKNIENLQPIANAHPVPGFKAALKMFSDYEEHKERADF